MDKIFEFILQCPQPILTFVAILVIVWSFEMFFFPFNINRLISRMDKTNEKLDKILELCGKDKSIREENGHALALLLGTVLEDQQKKGKDKG